MLTARRQVEIIPVPVQDRHAGEVPQRACLAGRRELNRCQTDFFGRSRRYICAERFGHELRAEANLPAHEALRDRLQFVCEEGIGLDLIDADWSPQYDQKISPRDLSRINRIHAHIEVLRRDPATRENCRQSAEIFESDVTQDQAIRHAGLYYDPSLTSDKIGVRRQALSGLS